jgi:hypothetical protein
MLPYPVLSILPDFTEPPLYGIANTVDRAGLSPARDTAFFPQDQADLTFGHNFLLNTRDECRAMKAFFLARGGRLAPFYLPSWRADLPAFEGVAGSNTAGDTQITVLAEDYAETHLDETHGDHYGRQLFIWQPGEDLFTAGVVGSHQETEGQAVLTVDRLLPFDIDKTTAIIGFLHLANFEGEELDYDHFTSAAAAVEIKFRSCRQWSTETPALTIARIDAAGLLGFVSAAVDTTAPTPGDSRVAWAAESAAWANPDGIRTKASVTPYDVTIPDGTGTVSALSQGIVDTAHLSMTFDADGELVLAWQHSATHFRLARHPSDPVYLDIAGLDPVLCSNLNVDGSVGEGENANAVYYRKPGDNRLYMRVSPGYSTEHAVAALPLRALKLKRVYEDGRTLKLEYVDAHFRRVILTSSPYPEL